MPNFTTTQAIPFNLGLPTDILDMETDQMDDFMAIGCSDGNVYIYKLDSKSDSNQMTHVATLKQHTKPVFCVRWLPMQFGRVLLTSGEDGLLAMYREQNQSFQKVAEQKFQAAVSDMAVSDDILAVTTLDGKLSLFQITAQLKLQQQDIQQFDVPLSVSMTKHAGDQKIIIGCLDGSVHLKQGNSKFTVIHQGSTPCKSVSFGSDLVTDQLSLALAYTDRVILFKVTDKPEFLKEQMIKDVSRAKFNVTGRVLGVSTENGTVQLIDAL
ncbi:Sec13 [Hexamita inflata]|uniref:Sec13 n=1 Tax=Hexamita inflata TaxID=28002 RepID=A0AA86PYT8_9EUKA|nr:Sec13 [Hexamita inflata]